MLRAQPDVTPPRAHTQLRPAWHEAEEEGQPFVPHLISFDIDGTLETGNGPGPITLEMVRRALEHGHIIGSASDRPTADQKNMWAAAGIEVSFTINKHRLNLVKDEFAHAEVFYHIGDTEL